MSTENDGGGRGVRAQGFRNNGERPQVGQLQQTAGQVGVAQRTVAPFRQYPDVIAAVERLARAGFPVDRVAVVGCDLRMDERVTGQVSVAGTTWRAALTGGVVGASAGWLLGLFGLVDPVAAGLWLAFNGFLLGAILGALAGLVGHASTGDDGRSP